MELRHLRAVVVLAEELHFGRAAAKLTTSQPALSQQIAQLERMCGVALFTRNSHRVAITEAGRAVVAEASAVLDRVEHLAAVMDRLREGTTGRIRLGVPANLPPALLPEVLARLQRSTPGVDLVVRGMPSREQAAALARGELDISLTRQTPDGQPVARREVLREALGVVVPADGELARLPEVHLGDLAGRHLHWLPAAMLPSLHAALRTGLAAAGVQLAGIHESPDLAATVHLVAAGHGFGLVLAREVTGAQARPGVVWRPLADLELHVALWAVWKEHLLTAAGRRVLEGLAASTRTFGLGTAPSPVDS